MRGGIIKNSVVNSITVLWALSEAMLGGILHALRLPFAGLFIGSCSVIFISLIWFYSGSKKDILKSMMIVLLVKAAVSPHTPPLAYLAVFIQVVIGMGLFVSKKLYRFSAILLGILTLTLSSIQKIVFYTVVYGNNLWYSIDELGRFITTRFPFVDRITSMSLWIIGIYSAVHMFAGIVAGVVAAGLPDRIRNAEVSIDNIKLDVIEKVPSDIKGRKKRTMWITSPSVIMIFSLVVVIIVFTYIFPRFSKNLAVNAIIMILRSILIMSLLIFVVSPYVTGKLEKILNNKKGKYSSEIKSVLNRIPLYKSIVAYCWRESQGRFLPIRISEFIITTFAYIFSLESVE